MAGFINQQRGQLCIVETQDDITKRKKVRICYRERPDTERTDAEHCLNLGAELPYHAGKMLIDAIGVPVEHLAKE
jgi:hypothetical protein